MASSLEIALRSRTRKVKAKRPSPPPSTAPLERDYFREMLPWLEAVRKEVTERYLAAIPARTDALVDLLGEIMDGIETRSRRRVENDSDRIRQTAADAARQTDRFNARAVSNQIEKVSGIPANAGVPDFEAKVRTFARTNANLIKSLPERYLSDVERHTQQALREGKRAAEIAGILEDRYQVAQSRAMLIARDQIGKLNANLTEERHKTLGIDSYVWRTSQDERVRDEHADRAGRVYRYSDPPSDGNPGEPIQCRCWADPVIDF